MEHLQEALSRKLSITPSLITAIHLQHTYGILVNVDDLVSEAIVSFNCFVVCIEYV